MQNVFTSNAMAPVLSRGEVIVHTMHPIRLHKLLVLFVNTEGTQGKLLNVFIQVPAQILIKDCE